MAIIAGVTIPILVIVLAVAAYLVLPGLLKSNQTASPDPTATASATEDPGLAMPAVGTCFQPAPTYDSFEDVRNDAEQDEPVPCEQTHVLETIAAAPLEGDLPFVPSAEARDLYDECNRSAEEFLGVPWRTMRTWLVVSLPSPRAFREGAQWYRCDLVTTDSYYGIDHLETSGSLRDTAEPLGCLTWEVADDSLTGIAISGCDVTHQGEVAGGLWARDLERSDEDAFLRELDAQCESVVLRFLGQETLHSELSYWYIYPSNDIDYNQSVVCVVSAVEDGRSFTGSVEGIGSGSIPFA